MKASAVVVAAILAACGSRSAINECFGTACDETSIPAQTGRYEPRGICLRSEASLPEHVAGEDAPSSGGGDYDGPPIGAIRWDAWTMDQAVPWWSIAGFGNLVPPGSKFHFREPSLWEEFQLYGPAVDTGAIVEREIAAAKGKLDFWLYGWYPPAEILTGTGDETPVSDLMNVFSAHVASASKNDVKFALRLEFGWMMHPNVSGAHFEAFCKWIAARVKDAAYERIDGRPLIALYNDSPGGGWSQNLDRWLELVETIGEPVYAVSVNSISMLQALGLQGNMTYGPNGADHSGTGQKSYAAQMAIDSSRDGAVPGAQPISSRTAMNDRRPMMRRGSENTTWWVDQPTQPQWVSSMRSAISNTQKLVMIYSWDEIGESGPGIVPTLQEGTRYLDAIDWVRTGAFPASYTYPLDFGWLSVTSDGNWTHSSPDPPNIIPAHDGDEVVSSTPGDYREFVHPGLQEVHIHATTGPDRGKVDILRDCSDLMTIDLYSKTTKVSADVATVKFADPPASHSIRVTVRGDKNPSSSSVQVGLDYAEVTYDPSTSIPGSGSLPASFPMPPMPR